MLIIIKTQDKASDILPQLKELLWEREVISFLILRALFRASKQLRWEIKLQRQCDPVLLG